MPSSSSFVRVFSLLSAAFTGGAVGMLLERSSSTRHREHDQAGELVSSLPQDAGSEGSLADAGLTPMVQKTICKGLPSNDRVRLFGGFVASLNYERRIPNWVLEYFPNPGSTTAVAARGKRKDAEKGKEEVLEGGREEEEEGEMVARREAVKFFADPDVPEAFRVLPDDYSWSGRHRRTQQQHTRGLSRGHLAAAQFHKHSESEMAQTFNMNANIVPQDMTMNAVDWLRLENLTKKLLQYYEGGLWVVTGPVFHPRYVRGDVRSWRWTEPRGPITVTSAQDVSDGSAHEGKAHKVVFYELVGKHDVAVPSHLFKVFLGERADGSHEAAAFLMPNEPLSMERPLISYQVPVAEIERMTGLQFFSKCISGSPSSWGGSKAYAKGLDVLPDVCKSVLCETRTAPLFQAYRNVARLRATQSIPELQQVYAALIAEQRKKGRGDKLDDVVLKEYNERKMELVEEAVSEIDR